MTLLGIIGTAVVFRPQFFQMSSNVWLPLRMSEITNILLNNSFNFQSKHLEIDGKTNFSRVLIAESLIDCLPVQAVVHYPFYHSVEIIQIYSYQIGLFKKQNSFIRKSNFTWGDGRQINGFKQIRYEPDPFHSSTGVKFGMDNLWAPILCMNRSMILMVLSIDRCKIGR